MGTAVRAASTTKPWHYCWAAVLQLLGFSLVNNNKQRQSEEEVAAVGLARQPPATVVLVTRLVVPYS
jgi:hypothetical protein